MIPVIPVRQIVCMPGIESSIRLGRKFSINAANLAMENKQIVLVVQKDIKDLDITVDDIEQYGILAETTNLTKTKNDNYNLFVKGIKRVKLKKLNYDKEKNSFMTEVINVRTKMDLIDDENYKKTIYNPEYLVAMATDLFTNKSFVKSEEGMNLLTASSLEELLDILVYFVSFPVEVKQKYIRIRSLGTRIKEFYKDLSVEKQKAHIEESVNIKVKEIIDESQRNYYLKEKMKVIKEELGDDTDDYIEGLYDKLEASEMPKDFKEKVLKDLKKLEKTPQMSAEYNVLLNYIELVLELPFKASEKKAFDLKKAKQILDEDHYGLKEVKDAVLEFLAVIELKKKLAKKNTKKTASVLCLVGPPGIGKTSFANSIARAMNREFSKISLGGVDDESEIRGHRRTYVAAMPGRIIEAVKRTGVNNPVILLDEIDKLDSNFRGDPSSALLEVLDPAQNYKFEDHFIDYPYDLSNVFFICTANNYSTIPEPLYDRLEVIYIDSYTELEKLNIAMKYLISQVAEETGIKLNLKEDIVLKIINSYTREAGVRNLKRELVKLARKMARETLEESKKKFIIGKKNLVKYLGPEKYKPEKMAEKKAKKGSVTGLAWTSVGGTTLEVQALKMQGDGKLMLTGKLGEVMQESAKVAYSFVRSIKDKKNNFEKDSDIHLHFPEGAVPKDGPSAGITITTAILSVVSNKKVRQDLAMTGEITLTGEVLAVGGIKEKVIAAHRIGIREVILPKENEVDTKELPAEILKDMNFNFVANYNEVIKIALVN
ncbi:endopeptidase La [Oceanivirga salmonicida]|uniref:endopeptidase La n=1 Tax=Oceanivirga salmonicida TaxID=1769291 RepID=UPI000831D729|nr:endopeptidase La [Oceanivirga salmonicida]